MSEQMYISETLCRFFVGRWVKATLESQLALSKVKASPEIWHYLGWYSYSRYTKKEIFVELLEVNRVISICDSLILLSEKGYRSVALQELLMLVQKRSSNGLPGVIVLPNLNWSKLVTEKKYIILRRDKGAWRIGGMSFQVGLMRGWKIACVKIWK